MKVTIETVLKHSEQIKFINLITNIIIKFNIQSLDHLKLVLDNRKLSIDGIVYGFSGSHFWAQHNDNRFFIVTKC